MAMVSIPSASANFNSASAGSLHFLSKKVDSRFGSNPEKQLTLIGSIRYLYVKSAVLSDRPCASPEVSEDGGGDDGTFAVRQDGPEQEGFPVVNLTISSAILLNSRVIGSSDLFRKSMSPLSPALSISGSRGSGQQPQVLFLRRYRPAAGLEQIDYSAAIRASQSAHVLH
jgi:hypothetical protein